MNRTFAAVSAAVLALVAMPAAAQDWQGGYIGVAGGYGFVADDDNETTPFDTNLDGNFNDTVNTAPTATPPSANAFSPGFCSGSPNSNNAAAGCSDDDDPQGELGFRAGYDWQRGSMVFGIVGEFTVSDTSDSVTAFSITPAQYSFERTLTSIKAVRGRVGMPYGRFLPYVTAGVAYGTFDNEYVTSNTVNTFSPTSEDSENFGFQVGGGVETHVAERVRLGVEYLYTSIEDDSDFTVRIAGGPATSPFRQANANGTDQRRGASDFDVHSVRLTLGFAF
jgi:outer membrane immunogenic protein